MLSTSIVANLPMNQVLVAKDNSENPMQVSSENQYLKDLKNRDAEVRSHEASHAAAAGPYLVRGPQYQYTIGPDGRVYATGGNVQIDMSAVRNNPSATIQKAQQLRSAATAVSEPSSADLAAASLASYMENEAISQLSERKPVDFLA
jgi:hypothetical protein